MDDSDSTGVTHFELLPEIDLYLKKQLLRDKTLYMKPLYGDRVFTDFYRRKFNVHDTVTYQSKPLDISMANNVRLSWHIGLGNIEGDIIKFSRIMRPVKALLPPSYDISFIPPNHKRDIDIMARGRRYYERNTIRYHRERIGRILDGMNHLNNALQGHVTVSRYKEEMSRGKVVVSPFGWGEIGVRDFEACLYGAALVKPDMSHMATWPDIFIADKTYQPFKWDFSDIEYVINDLLGNPNRRMELAEEGQQAYKRMISKQGMENFCSWFIQQINL